MLRATSLVAVSCAIICGCAADAVDGSESAVQRAVEVSRWGSLDGKDSFSRVAGIALLPGGKVAVAQPMDGMIRILSPDGVLLRTIGRRGNGPGEFVDLSGVGWNGETLWAYDVAGFRISRFDSSGALLQSIQPRTSIPGTYLPLADGFLVFPSLPSSSVLENLVLTRTDSAGFVADTVGSLRFPSGFNIVIPFGGRRIYMAQPIPDYSLFQLTPDGSGVMFADRTAPTGSRGTAILTSVSSAGDTLWTARLEGSAQPVEADFVDRFFDKHASTMPPLGGAGEMKGAYKEHITVPSFYPLVDQLVPTAEGTAWVRMSNGLDDTLGIWRHVTANGELDTRRIAMPAGLRVYHVRNDTFWGVELDSLDVPYIVRMTPPAILSRAARNK